MGPERLVLLVIDWRTVERYGLPMVMQEQAQSTQAAPVAPKPETSEPPRTAARVISRLASSRLILAAANLGGNVDFPRWLRRKSQLPAWQVVLTAVLIIVASAVVPGISHRHTTQTATTANIGSMPVVTDSLPVDLPVPASSALVQSQPTADTNTDQQIAGLQDSTQQLLKQIEQAQHDNAALRAEIQSQDQNLGTTQSQVAAADAERATQQQQLQGQTSAVVKNATDQLSQMNQAVTALDTQVNLLRQTVGMGQGSYPAVSIPDLATSADPAQAFDSALNSLQAHIGAVANDLQTVKSTAQRELAFAQSVNVRPIGSGTLVHGTGQLSWPTTGTISQYYGPTSLSLEPAYGGYPHFHLGVDIANSQGTPIGAAAAGTVIFAGWTNAGYGNMVEIDHGNGLVTIYGHMMTTPSVRSGQHVFKGQLIGYIGSTGNSTGPHLHFGVQHYGSWDNPLKYLP